MRACLTLALFSFTICLLTGQGASDYAVQVSASVTSDPPAITLSWPGITSNNYVVHRKLKSGTSWGSTFAQLPGDATSFTDTTAMTHVSYEYRLTRTTNSLIGYGYINSGIQIPETPQHGGLILLVDTTLTDSLASEIDRLQYDISMDGWDVIRYDVDPSVPPDSVKAMIVEQYNNNPGFIKSVFLVGHVAVPYSGSIAPDGHVDHGGAWPADVYYGEMNSIWTDVSINSTTASDPRNDNVPGDGKFDQSNIPSDIELQVGRIDFSNLPVFGGDSLARTIALTRSYLDRNHAFRMRAFIPEHRAVIDDNFGAFSGEAFASGGWRGFAPLVGAENVMAGDYRMTLSEGSYLLSYGCGGGSYTSCGGVGSSTQFADDSLQTIFTMLFGSYFGDWDKQDNLMRTALAQGSTLAIVWSGRPHWMIHHMGLGENIGYSARLTQNNSIQYNSNFGARSIHVALLGDPTLRMQYVSPPRDLSAELSNNTHVTLMWNAPEEPVQGYHVYRRHSAAQRTELLTPEMLDTTIFLDACLLDEGEYLYSVRAVALQETPSGSFYNMSTGIGMTVELTGDNYVHAGFDFMLTGDSLYIIENASVNATEYHWNFGDGNTSDEMLPMHVYETSGNYTITLIASSECDADTITQEIEILSGVPDTRRLASRVFPNPVHGSLSVMLPEHTGTYHLRLIAPDGTCIRDERHHSDMIIDVSTLPRGLYVLLLDDAAGNAVVHRVMLQ